MPDTHTTSVDQQRLEKERIEDNGSAAGAKDHQV